MAEDSFAAIEVFADELQAAGDPRGELLALELASERASSSAEARRLNEQAQRLRSAHGELAWPAALRDARLSLRAGLPVAGEFPQFAGLDEGPELMASLRRLELGRENRLEDAVGDLAAARRVGMQLEGLVCFGRGAPIELGRLDELLRVAEGPPELEELFVLHESSGLSALRAFTGLRRLFVYAALDEARLCSLAGLALESLGFRARHVEPVLLPLFGASLRALVLSEFEGSLEGLEQLPGLRELTAPNPKEPSLEGLARLRLESLDVETLGPESLAALAWMPLRSLKVEEFAAANAGLLAGLEQLEVLDIWACRGELELAVLSELPALRELGLPEASRGTLELPAGLESLTVHGNAPLSVLGSVPRLHCVHGDPTRLPPSLLAGVEELRLSWRGEAFDAGLGELPRLCPRLERLEIDDRRLDDWTWLEGPQVLDGLASLRSFRLSSARLGERAELARAFPELCPTWEPASERSPKSWPRCAPRPRSTVGGARARAPAGAAEDGFGALRAWAEGLRLDGDPRGELLELELTAELCEDPFEARLANAEAARLRARHAKLAWPPELAIDRALLRGGLPVRSSGRWLCGPAPSLDLMQPLRAVEFTELAGLGTGLTNLAFGQRTGMRLEALSLTTSEPSEVYDGEGAARILARRSRELSVSTPGLGLLAELDSLRELKLDLELGAEQRARCPRLELRSLILGSGNEDRELVARLGARLESLVLVSGSLLRGLELPCLRALTIFDAGDPSWLLGQRGLRKLALMAREARVIEALAELELRELCVLASPALLGRTPRCLPDLERLEVIVDGPGTLELPGLADMTRLKHLRVTARAGHVALELPPACRSLSLQGVGSLALRGGAVEALACTPSTLERSSSGLRAGLRELELKCSRDESVAELGRLCPKLERLELRGEWGPTVGPSLRTLDELPRLRTVVFPAGTVGYFAHHAGELPRVDLRSAGVRLCEPGDWPRPPGGDGPESPSAAK